MNICIAANQDLVLVYSARKELQPQCFLSHYLIFGCNYFLAVRRLLIILLCCINIFTSKRLPLHIPLELFQTRCLILSNIFNVFRIILRVVNALSLGTIWNFLLVSAYIQIIGAIRALVSESFGKFSFLYYSPSFFHQLTWFHIHITNELMLLDKPFLKISSLPDILGGFLRCSTFEEWIC